MRTDIGTFSSIRRSLQGRLALVGGSKNNLIELIRDSGNIVVPFPLSASDVEVRAVAEQSDIILIDLSIEPRNIVTSLKKLNAAIGLCGFGPRILGFSIVHRNPKFILEIERQGVRYVRIERYEAILDAIELVLSENRFIEIHGLCFKIVHKYSEGFCAPGEEVFAILLAHGGAFFQLEMGLAERLLFDFLAQHQRIALDSEQITGGLRAGWFYRDHASNTGRRNTKKIRRASIKVLVQRIRRAMGAVFIKANMPIDPKDVLRSCLAEGSNKVLYKIHGRIDWEHPLTK